MRRTTQFGALFIIAFICFFWHLASPISRSTARNEEAPPPPPLGGQDAKAIYARNCATCHGKDGRAKTFKAKFNRARNLTDAAWQSGVSDERIFNSIMNGRGGKMPAFGKKLSEADVNALVAHVRSLKK